MEMHTKCHLDALFWQLKGEIICCARMGMPGDRRSSQPVSNPKALRAGKHHNVQMERTHRLPGFRHCLLKIRVSCR